MFWQMDTEIHVCRIYVMKCCKQNKQNDPKFQNGFEKIFFYFKKIRNKIKIPALKKYQTLFPCFACKWGVRENMFTAIDIYQIWTSPKTNLYPIC